MVPTDAEFEVDQLLEMILAQGEDPGQGSLPMPTYADRAMAEVKTDAEEQTFAQNHFNPHPSHQSHGAKCVQQLYKSQLVHMTHAGHAEHDMYVQTPAHQAPTPLPGYGAYMAASSYQSKGCKRVDAMHADFDMEEAAPLAAPQCDTKPGAMPAMGDDSLANLDRNAPLDNSSRCWGAELTGDSSRCTPGFLLGHAHFKNKFCAACRQSILVPVERVRALTSELQPMFSNTLRAGFWKTASPFIGGGLVRVVNNTHACEGPYLALYKEPPPEHAWGELPAGWVVDGQVQLTVAKGTLVPVAALWHPASGDRRPKRQRRGKVSSEDGGSPSSVEGPDVVASVLQGLTEGSEPQVSKTFSDKSKLTIPPLYDADREDSMNDMPPKQGFDDEQLAAVYVHDAVGGGSMNHMPPNQEFGQQLAAVYEHLNEKITSALHSSDTYSLSRAQRVVLDEQLRRSRVALEQAQAWSALEEAKVGGSLVRNTWRTALNAMKIARGSPQKPALLSRANTISCSGGTKPLHETRKLRKCDSHGRLQQPEERLNMLKEMVVSMHIGPGGSWRDDDIALKKYDSSLGGAHIDGTKLGDEALQRKGLHYGFLRRPWGRKKDRSDGNVPHFQSAPSSPTRMPVLSLGKVARLNARVMPHSSPSPTAGVAR